MIRTDWLRENEVIRVRPDGEIDEHDFAGVGAVVDPVIAERGRLEGLLIDARGFEGWDDTRALLAHLRFVGAHQSRVARIAAVGDQWWLREAPMMEPFFGTPIRVFDAAHEEAARAWLLERPAEPAALTVLPEAEGALIAVRIANRLRDIDYKTLEAQLTARIPASGNLRMLVVVDESFRGWTPKAFFDDFAMAFSPWRNRFERLAIVSGPGFVRWCVAHFPSGLMPYPIRHFGPEERDAALTWLRE